MCVWPQFVEYTFEYFAAYSSMILSHFSYQSFYQLSCMIAWNRGAVVVPKMNVRTVAVCVCIHISCTAARHWYSSKSQKGRLHRSFRGKFVKNPPPNAAVRFIKPHPFWRGIEFPPKKKLELQRKVILARSTAGAPLAPISWHEAQGLFFWIRLKATSEPWKMGPLVGWST